MGTLTNTTWFSLMKADYENSRIIFFKESFFFQKLQNMTYAPSVLPQFRNINFHFASTR